MSSGDAEARIDALEARIEALESSRGRGVEEEEEAGEAGERAGLIGAPQEAHQSSYLCAPLSATSHVINHNRIHIHVRADPWPQLPEPHFHRVALPDISRRVDRARARLCRRRLPARGSGWRRVQAFQLAYSRRHPFLALASRSSCAFRTALSSTTGHTWCFRASTASHRCSLSFLPELRAALRRNAVQTHGAAGASDVAVSALKSKRLF